MQYFLDLDYLGSDPYDVNTILSFAQSISFQNCNGAGTANKTKPQPVKGFVIGKPLHHLIEERQWHNWSGPWCFACGENRSEQEPLCGSGGLSVQWYDIPLPHSGLIWIWRSFQHSYHCNFVRPEPQCTDAYWLLRVRAPILCCLRRELLTHYIKLVLGEKTTFVPFI